MTECAFCRIARRELPARIVKEDDRAVAFRDINPQAPTHVLVIPREHISSLDTARSADADLLGHLLLMAQEVARIERVVQGYRIVVNNGPGAGQTVFHIHVHLLGGRAFLWPPG